MVKNLKKHGNSSALVIDKPLLELLDADIDTTFELTTDGRNLVLSPQSSRKDEEDILVSLEKINKSYKNVLGRLGEQPE
jgi:antitoxin component of MazEF toxin-antitoxin module